MTDAHESDSTFSNEVKKEVRSSFIKWGIGGIVALGAIAISGWISYLQPKIDGYIADKSNEIPSGTIISWYKKSGEIPDGWVICNGDNNTPDLRDQFIVGVSTVAEIGKKGGQNSRSDKTEAHSLIENELPSHQHGYVDTFYSRNNKDLRIGANASGGWLGREVLTDPVGKGHGHSHGLADVDNRPEFVGLLFLMKI